MQALEPAITPRLDEITAGRRIPLDIIAALSAAGIYRAYVPEALGGLELAPAEVFRAVIALSRIDGSVGWTAMLGTSAQLFLSLLPQDGYAMLYRDGPDLMFAGAEQPCGTAQRHGPAWRVEGRWPFASGCLHAAWLGGVAVEVDPSATTQGDGPAGLRVFVAPAARWRIEDSWRVMGLQGTGSHHIVPAAHDDRGPPLLRRVGPGQKPAKGASFSGPVSLVAARPRRLPARYRLVFPRRCSCEPRGRPSATRTAHGDARPEVAQSDFGRLTILHRAAQALHDDIVGEQWRATLAGDADDPALLSNAEAAATWIASACREVASTCFSLAGASAIGEHAALGRRWRDLQVAGQHVKVHPANYAGLGLRRIAA